jgi:multisubunit Na+/H+ antiporter MnhG subunit
LSSQVLARAAHRIGAKQAAQTVVDRLAEDLGAES